MQRQKLKGILVGFVVLITLWGSIRYLTSTSTGRENSANPPTQAALPTLTRIATGQPDETVASISSAAIPPATAILVADRPTNVPTTQPAFSTPVIALADSPIQPVPTSQPVTMPIPQQPVKNQIVLRFDSQSNQAEREAYIQSLGG